jgi:hypothetical protein
MAQTAAHSSTTLSLSISDYLDWHALRGSSKRHRQDIRRMLHSFAGRAGTDRLLDAVTREDFTNFRRGIQEQGSSKARRPGLTPGPSPENR